MRHVKIGRDILKHNGTGELSPVDYLLPEQQYHSLLDIQRSSGFRLIEFSTEITGEKSLSRINVEKFPDRGYCASLFGAFDYHGSEEILVYNTGGIGDQLWTTCIIHELKKQYPLMTIDVACLPKYDIVWFDNPDIRSVRSTPIPLTVAECYDVVIGYDEIVSSLDTPSQPNCYDVLGLNAGIRFTEDYPKPYIYPKYEDELSVFAEHTEPDLEGQVFRTRGQFVVGLHSSSMLRNLPKETLIEFIATLAASTNQKIFCLSDNSFGEEIQKVVRVLPNVVCLHYSVNLLQIAALCRYANCVIAPDSMLVHLAGAFEIPTVAIMSTVGPQYRVNYPYCVPIWNASDCPHAHYCFYKQSEPYFEIGTRSLTSLCAGTLETAHCRVIQSVTVKDIFDAINTATKRKITNGGYDFLTDLPLR